MSCGDKLIGWVVGESTPSRSVILISKEGSDVVRSGLYVVAETNGECVIGIVEKVVSGNPLLPEEVVDTREVEMLSSVPELTRRLYKRGYVRWLSKLNPLVEEGRVEAPRVPIDPSSPVYLADRYYLEKIFKDDKDSWIEIGSLVNDPSIRVGIDVNKLSRHLAILAVTGGGKSNTVCILARNIVKKLRGTVVIFDVHGEYSRAEIVPSHLQKVIEPKINPLTLSFSELLKLMRIPPNATNQERALREAWSEVLEEIRNKKKPKSLILEILREKIRSMISSGRSGRGIKIDPKAASGVLNRLDDLLENYGDVIDENMHTKLNYIIEPGKLNIFDLSEVDENGADAVVSHYLRRLIQERKLWKSSGGEKGYPSPVIVVVEEAHVLIPKDLNTLTKYWASRVAREGRKFGVGLVLVSQRPKGLDPDVLSQTNNKIILRIVEPTDQKYVREASEQLSEDLVELLPDLNPGEAIVIGSMVKIPALVKIDKCESLQLGADVNLVAEWRNLEREELSLEDLKNLTL
jgi:DNA helicase HerA-like ATPase